MNGTDRRLSAERNIEADSLCRPNPEEVESQFAGLHEAGAYLVQRPFKRRASSAASANSHFRNVIIFGAFDPAFGQTIQ
jgi:hypothetical protein